MLRTWLLSAVVILALSSAATAQTAWQFRWQTGQVFTYRVEHLSTVTDTFGEGKDETKTTLNLTKRWQVMDVDATGVATLQLSLTALRSETTKASGEVLLFDSANLDKSTPEMREGMTKFVNQPLALLRVDRNGKVVEVKESKFGPASRYESAPPFVLVLPGAEVRPGQVWERDYAITLAPPQGTGEKYQAAQHYTCKEIKDGMAVVALTTAPKTQPDAAADRIPLLQSLPEGEIVFDLQSGMMRSARLRIDRELKGHQGENSTYRLQSQYTEEYVGNR